MFRVSNVAEVPLTVVRRVEERRREGLRLYALEYLDMKAREHNRIARALAKLAMRIIANRVRVD